MIKIFPSCQIRGPRFSPGVAQKRLHFKLQNCREAGEIGKRGRYINKPFPHGSATLILAEGAMKLADIERTLAELSEDIKILEECGAVSITFWLNIAYTGQCNLELTPYFIKQLSILGIPLCVTVYESS